MEIKNTYDDVVITYARRSGNTTRQIDQAIQLLFRGHAVKVIDHHCKRERMGYGNANRHLFDGILRRLQSEHNLQHLIDTDGIRMDIAKSEIELTPKTEY